MKTKRMVFSLIITLVMTLTASVALAGDFEWTKDFNIKAELDRDGFRAQLATRFRIGNAEVDIVLGNVDSPADAYMVLRLGEMSAKPVGYVLNQYRAKKNQGWGVLARSLGIKPGSKEFHALKSGNDLNGPTYHTKGKNKGKKKG